VSDLDIIGDQVLCVNGKFNLQYARQKQEGLPEGGLLLNRGRGVAGVLQFV
jgi:hypothetical protein